jgi:hypothetical protein
MHHWDDSPAPPNKALRNRSHPTHLKLVYDGPQRLCPPFRPLPGAGARRLLVAEGESLRPGTPKGRHRVGGRCR